jgi:hypothetical protein
MAESRMPLETKGAVAVREASVICNSVAKGIDTKSLSMSRVRAVREALFAKQLSDEWLEDENAGVVCDHISLLDVTNFLSKHDSLGFRIRFDPAEGQDINARPEKIMGKLIALEIPSFAHAGAAGEITEQIKASVRSIVDKRTLRSWASPTCRIGASLKEPDSSIGPRGHESETTARKATTVVEIVYLHGTSEDLKRSLSTWISPESYVRTAIGIKISRKLSGSNRPMLALLYEKGAIDNPVQEIEFGTDVANVEGLTLNVSLQNVFFGAHSVQELALRTALQADSKIGISLAKLQKDILQVNPPSLLFPLNSFVVLQSSRKDSDFMLTNKI